MLLQIHTIYWLNIAKNMQNTSNWFIMSGMFSVHSDSWIFHKNQNILHKKVFCCCALCLVVLQVMLTRKSKKIPQVAHSRLLNFLSLFFSSEKVGDIFAKCLHSKVEEETIFFGWSIEVLWTNDCDFPVRHRGYQMLTEQIESR